MARVLIRSCSACGQAFGDNDGSWFINKQGVRCHACSCGSGKVGALVDMTLEAHQKLMDKSLIERGMATASTAVFSPIQCPLCGGETQRYPKDEYGCVNPSVPSNWKNAHGPHKQIRDFKKYYEDMLKGLAALPSPPPLSSIPPYMTATQAAMAKISPPPQPPPPPNVEYYCDQCNVYWFSDDPQLSFGNMPYFLRNAKGESEMRSRIERMARNLSGLPDSYPMPNALRPWPDSIESIEGRLSCASCKPLDRKMGVVVDCSSPTNCSTLHNQIKLERMPPIHGHDFNMTAKCHSCGRTDFYRKMSGMPPGEEAVLMASEIKEKVKIQPLQERFDEALAKMIKPPPHFDADEIAARPQMRAAFAKCFGPEMLVDVPAPDVTFGDMVFHDDYDPIRANLEQKLQREVKEDADVLALREKLRVALAAQK